MSSIKKFNPHKEIRIDRVKAHHTYLRPKKEKPSFRDTTDYEGDWEHDGKPFKKKKELKKEKLSRAFVMMDDKKYHEIDGRYIPAGL